MEILYFLLSQNKKTKLKIDFQFIFSGIHHPSNQKKCYLKTINGI